MSLPEPALRGPFNPIGQPRDPGRNATGLVPGEAPCFSVAEIDCCDADAAGVGHREPGPPILDLEGAVKAGWKRQSPRARAGKVTRRKPNVLQPPNVHGGQRSEASAGGRE